MLFLYRNKQNMLEKFITFIRKPKKKQVNKYHKLIIINNMGLALREYKLLAFKR